MLILLRQQSLCLSFPKVVHKKQMAIKTKSSVVSQLAVIASHITLLSLLLFLRLCPPRCRPRLRLLACDEPQLSASMASLMVDVSVEAEALIRADCPDCRNIFLVLVLLAIFGGTPVSSLDTLPIALVRPSLNTRRVPICKYSGFFMNLK